MIETLQRPTSTSPEIFNFPEYSALMEEMEKKDYDSFSQINIFKEHVLPNGRTITKGVGISLSGIPGMTPQMREDIISQTIGAKIRAEDHEKGMEKGEIFWASRDIEGELNLEVLINRFIRVNGDIVDQRHPFRHHRKVEKYLSLQGSRYKFIPTILEDALRILHTPSFTGWSAANPKYEGDGNPFLVEYYRDTDGVAWGGDLKGRPMRLDKIATDEPHQNWMVGGLISMASEPMEEEGGWRVGGNGEDTECAEFCDADFEKQRGSCADFFKLMKNGGINTALQRDGVIRLMDPLGITYSEKSSWCFKHEQSIKTCACYHEEQSQAA
jgi:hypothetical protein